MHSGLRAGLASLTGETHMRGGGLVVFGSLDAGRFTQ